MDKTANRPITRRDFLNGMLLAAGGIAIKSFFPMRLAEASCDGPIGTDPRVIRGGNLQPVLDVGHWLRDRRLSFNATTVDVAASACDDVQGNFPIVEDSEVYDVVIVGSGISGLAAAFYLSRRWAAVRILLLDGNTIFGGNAARDAAPPIPVISSTAGAYAALPYADFLEEIYRTVGIDWPSHIIADPFYCYFFDDHTPYALPGAHGWTRDVYGKGLKDMPYPRKIIQDLHKAKQDFRNWYVRHGAPTDPADDSDPRFDFLSGMTLQDYLMMERGYHAAVSDFYNRYSIDALAGPANQVSAYTGISFLGAEYNPKFTLPGGLSGVARHILRWLIPGVIAGPMTDEIITNPIDPSRLDVPGSRVQVRQSAMALRTDTADHSASVIYYKDGEFRRAAGRAVILAGQTYTTKHLVDHLLDQTARDAFGQITLAPALVANVTLNSAASLVSQGLGYNQYWWGSDHWASFVIADWVSSQRDDPNRSTVLTVYGGNPFGPALMRRERFRLLFNPFSTYENSLREDLNRILGPGGFDFDRDVSALYLYRWGHALVYPKPGYPFAPPANKQGRAVRVEAARHIARMQLGRISFAGQDLEGSPAIESAIGSGLRCAQEALEIL